MRIRLAVITVSDRAARGERADESGPALVEAIRAAGWAVEREVLVGDNLREIVEALTGLADNGEVDVVLTTGGTGFAPRDVTPEATAAVIEREAPGLGEAMRAASASRSPHAMLSRARAGIRGNVLIVNLPGSPTAAVENFHVVEPALVHAVQLLHDSPQAEAGHAKRVV